MVSYWSLVAPRFSITVILHARESEREKESEKVGKLTMSKWVDICVLENVYIYMHMSPRQSSKGNVFRVGQEDKRVESMHQCICIQQIIRYNKHRDVSVSILWCFHNGKSEKTGAGEGRGCTTDDTANRLNWMNSDTRVRHDHYQGRKMTSL